MTAIKYSKMAKELDPSIYSAAFRWYTSIVFNQSRQKERNFDLSYLEQFDRYFFSSVKYIISEDQTLLFHALVQSLVDGLLTASRPRENLGLRPFNPLQRWKEV